MPDPDYSSLFGRIAEALERIAVATERIADADESIDNTLKAMDFKQAEQLLEEKKIRVIQDEIRRYAVTESLGIYIQPSWHEQRLTRAITMNALRRSNQIDDVIAELNSPTDLPGL